MEDQKIKMCPFCGGEAELEYWYEGFCPDKVNVICTRCKAKSAEFPYTRNDEESKNKAEEKAILSWNRRIIIAE